MAVLNICVKSLEVIQCGPALASATISILKQLSRYNLIIYYDSLNHNVIIFSAK